MATKYKNIVGSAFLPHIKKQFETRSSLVKKKTRSNSDIQYLTNRNAWFRLSSSAETTNFIPPKAIPNPYGPQEEGVTPRDEIEKQNLENLENFNNSFSGGSAKNNVLQGGTIISGNNDSTTLRKGFNQTYKKGPTDDLGLKPMPGITGITIGTGGKWQTLMQADVEIICYDLDQLNEMSKLYMSLGVTCFLEWGHIPYLDNSGILKNTNPNLDFFGEKDKNQLIKSIAKQREKTGGNYDGFVGTVYNFSYQGDKDGAFMCKVQLMGAGGMVESLKINTSFNIDFTNAADSNASDKYFCTLDNALASFSEFLKQGKIYGTTKTTKQADDFSSRFIGIISNTTPPIVDINGTFGKVSKESFFKNFTASGTTNQQAKSLGINLKWGTLLNKIYGSAAYSPFSFIDNNEEGTVNYTNENSPAKYGNAHQIISGISSDNDGLSPIPTKFYAGYAGAFRGGFWDWKIDADKDIQSFITFGHLLALINSLGIFVESKTKTLNKDATPVLYIDYHPDNTEIDLAPVVASINPFKCIVPFKPITPYEDFFGVLSINEPTNWPWNEADENEGLLSHNLNKAGVGNKINDTYPPSEFVDSKNKGKLMNVLINIDFARDTLRKTKDSNNDVNLIEYLTKILAGINESLGGVNNFRTFVDECGSVLRIIDEKLLEPIIDPNDSRLVTIPTFGTTSIAYDASYSSAITPKLSSQIVIATQAQGGGIQDFSEDVLSYQSLNAGVKDRFSSYKFPAIKNLDKVDQKTKDAESAKNVKLQLKLYDHIWTVYTTDPEEISNTNCNNMTSPYIDLSNTTSKKTFSGDANQNKNKSSILIPLEYTVTIDGIGGILPYNAFRIPNNRLPERYRDRVAFAVFSINHSFENNSWLTTLRGQTIMLDTPKTLSTTTTVGGGKDANPPRPITSIPLGYPNENLTGITTTDKTTLDSPNPTVTNTTGTGTETIITVNTPPDGGQQTTFSTGNAGPITSNADIEAAFIFIANNETNGTPELKAYKDIDYTVSAGFTYRIGYGSDTITDTNGRVTKVTSSSRTTPGDAKLDLTRRIIKDFKPKVVSRLNQRGVNYNDLPLKVQVVFLDLAYNYGTLWFDFIEAYKADGKAGVIAELNRRIARGESQVPSRRKKEIAYLNG